ncbi:MAG TPA: hypothetical protein VK206_05680, partial [Anaerolineales bacterium]|nr:hypothetical protein [Anaerolineales bacterium]
MKKGWGQPTPGEHAVMQSAPPAVPSFYRKWTLSKLATCIEINDDEKYIFGFPSHVVYDILYHYLNADRNTVSASFRYINPATDQNSDASP